MIASIDDQRAPEGVELICKFCRSPHRLTMRTLPSGIGPLRLWARARHDAAMRIEVRRVFEANVRVYGVRTVWRQLKRGASTLPAARWHD